MTRDIVDLGGTDWRFGCVPLKPIDTQPDALPGRLRRRDYESAIGMTKEAGINLLHVWGGGLREKRAFYDLCDGQGIMVWQEFPLACLLLGHLPHSARFRNLLREEGRSIVRQLRNHPSLALWCGGNEFSYRRNRRLIDCLHEVVSAEDGTRPFRRASPGRGDTHNWLVWHGKAPIPDYRNDRSQFSSEFGLQSIPHASSLSRFLTTENLFPPNDVWCHHCAQLEKLERYAGPASSSTLQEWTKATQRGQANGLQVAIFVFAQLLDVGETLNAEGVNNFINGVLGSGFGRAPGYQEVSRTVQQNGGVLTLFTYTAGGAVMNAGTLFEQRDTLVSALIVGAPAQVFGSHTADFDHAGNSHTIDETAWPY